MNYRYIPFYLEFPILKIIYVVLWIPFGFLVSSILNTVLAFVISFLETKILSITYSYAFEMYHMSGRMKYIIEPLMLCSTIIIDLVLLIVGLELISKFINDKKRGLNE